MVGRRSNTYAQRCISKAVNHQTIKVWHITRTLYGGAGIYASRLSQALREAGVSSCVLSGDERPDEGGEFPRFSRLVSSGGVVPSGVTGGSSVGGATTTGVVLSVSSVAGDDCQLGTALLTFRDESNPIDIESIDVNVGLPD